MHEAIEWTWISADAAQFAVEIGALCRQGFQGLDHGGYLSLQSSRLVSKASRGRPQYGPHAKTIELDLV